VSDTIGAARERAAIFDLDGTLADTQHDIADAMDRVLAQAGFAPLGREAYGKLIGHGLQDLVRQALPPQARSADPVARSLADMLADYGEHCLVATRLYDGVAPVLAELRARGLKLAVLSNKVEPLTRRIVHGLCGPRAFDLVMGARPGVPLKPDPTAALRAAALLGVAPSAVAFVGDSAVDMHTALAAGMRAVGVSWGLRGREELVGAGAQAIAERPADLLGALS
jgi:phosphoglycolate phosphatase